MKIWPVVLSGGSGTRLWPLSRAHYPKQFLPIHSDQAMIQDTLARFGDPARFAPPLIIANDDHRFIVAEKLAEMGIDPLAIILEPGGKGTAPAAIMAALRLEQEDDQALMLLAPSDHVITALPDFMAALERATAAASGGKLVTFGIKADHPETGYGYIESGPALDQMPGAFAVAHFHEKPDAQTAQGYLDQGNVYWNSGIFLFRCDHLIKAYERHAPDMLKACRAALAGSRRDLAFERPDSHAFMSGPEGSIDRVLMEKAANVAVVPVDMGWSDLGSFRALWDHLPKNQDGNVLEGDIIALDSRNCLLRADGAFIAALGIEDLIIVTTKDTVLIAHKNRAEEVGRVVDQLKAQKREEHLMHPRVYRPWGSYETTDRGDRFQSKRIIVKPGEKLSLQKHHHRAEHWIVVEGTALVTRDEESFLLSENESCYIPLGSVHRLENPGKIPLHLIEVQSGSYLGKMISSALMTPMAGLDYD
ncbi:mannose-1-phosphate guanylyltransferase/mannose-6-phosphate isomerase [Iodidimonas nitroreducens]|uniref:mannose-1-phosphate guanylyltransferase n=1 Tax=Iodidimonas nitroreducens TaxID=1236968 RepID=A0A5A7N944_9PROT|nr:mannose-1-phosphate guanylyltransferase/mannose-6-phosphate isomerase [Iodidimonas nitroreducens]GER04861.1 mannose-1-phosphate guanylyltransferase/mannose-6-phosphate isomerase [Iodidimonas nitroreducens]